MTGHRSLLLVLLAQFICLPASAHYVDAGEYSANRTISKSGDKLTSLQPEKNAAVTDVWTLLNQALTPDALAFASSVNITIQDPYRFVRSNGIPDHATGAFPNSGNPNTISEQKYLFRMPLKGQATGTTTPLHMSPFGVAVNGIPFDPGAAEYWHRDRNSGWQYEAMVLGPKLGLDQNNAHVQPNGAYHYHGIPTALLERLRQANKPVLIGYAADGFPIYGPYGYKNADDTKSGLTKLKASYRIKKGHRTSAGTNGGGSTYGGDTGPGGQYDGSFVQDYEYVVALGDLDDCNGRFGITAEYPQGTYYYVVTDSYPFIPRAFKGTPDDSFLRHGPPGGGRGNGAGGPPGGGPPDGGPFGRPFRPPGGGAPGNAPPGAGPPNDGPPNGGPPNGGRPDEGFGPQ